jgi:hypothetical protein
VQSEAEQGVPRAMYGSAASHIPLHEDESRGERSADLFLQLAQVDRLRPLDEWIEERVVTQHNDGDQDALSRVEDLKPAGFERKLRGFQNLVRFTNHYTANGVHAHEVESRWNSWNTSSRLQEVRKLGTTMRLEGSKSLDFAGFQESLGEIGWRLRTDVKTRMTPERSEQRKRFCTS